MQEDFLQYARPNSSLTDLLASTVNQNQNVSRWDAKGNFIPTPPQLFADDAPVVLPDPLDEYAKVYAGIPDEYRTSVVNPQGTNIAAHAATYNPYIEAKRKAENIQRQKAKSGQTASEVVTNDGDEMMDGNSIYTWIGNGYVYRGENTDPNLLDKRQFMANYKQKEAEIDTVVQSLSESPGTLPQATPISLPGWTIPGMSNLFTQQPNIGNNNQSGLAGSLNRLTSNPLPFNQWFN
tara:strand:- start:175 stop:882 length:708 start_codon:yes stop_codon:yes gene_type:complete